MIRASSMADLLQLYRTALASVSLVHALRALLTFFEHPVLAVN